MCCSGGCGLGCSGDRGVVSSYKGDFWRQIVQGFLATHFLADCRGFGDFGGHTYLIGMGLIYQLMHLFFSDSVQI